MRCCYRNFSLSLRKTICLIFSVLSLACNVNRVSIQSTISLFLILNWLLLLLIMIKLWVSCRYLMNWWFLTNLNIHWNNLLHSMIILLLQILFNLPRWLLLRWQILIIKNLIFIYDSLRSLIFIMLLYTLPPRTELTFNPFKHTRHGSHRLTSTQLLLPQLLLILSSCKFHLFWVYMIPNLTIWNSFTFK